MRPFCEVAVVTKKLQIRRKIALNDLQVPILGLILSIFSPIVIDVVYG
jgi:hypothetical protein